MVIPSPSTDISREDWEALFDAVIDTLAGQAILHPANAAGPRSASVLVDCVSALRQLRSTLVHERPCPAAACLSQQDDLTALPNRTSFRRRLGDAVSQARAPHRTPAVLYIDLDGFKPINDRHGHAVGDEVLRVVAARLSQAMRAGDMISRYGGDEFACLVAEVPDRRHLDDLASRLLRVVSAPLEVGRVQLEVRLSVGIATWPADGATPDALLNSADEAMYRAKRQRSGYAFFSEGYGA